MGEKTEYSLKDFGVKRHEGVLKNGLKVVFIEKPFAPINAKILMRAGSIFDPMDRLGLAHFAEHIIVSGSKEHSKESFSRLLESVGGYWNAGTSSNTLSVECEIAVREHLPNIKQYFTHALTTIDITPEKLGREKQIIISEIERARSRPYYNGDIYISSVFANGTQWYTPTLGTKELVSSITVEEVKHFFNKYCCVENMVLVISGGCTWKDIEKTFSDIPFLHGAQHELPLDPEPILPQTIIFEQDTPQTNIALYFRGPPISSREDYLITFALRYAHDGITSRFYKKIRNELGLAYSLSYSTKPFKTLTYLGTAVGVPTDKVQPTIDAMFECYKELLDEGITQNAIDEKINTLWFSAKRSKETAESWVEVYGYDALYPDEHPLHGPYPDVYNYRKTYTSEEINAVLKKYITLDTSYLILNGKEVGKYTK